MTTPYMTRRQTIVSMLSVSLVPALPGLARAAAPPLAWQGFRGGQNDFYRAPILLSGEREAILIDGSFNYPAGEALVEEIKATSKELTTIYISCNDPDYYFSLKPVAEAFPNARVIAASDTIDLIRKKAEGKLAVWGPVLGENGPQTLDDLVFPEPYDDDTLTLEDTVIDIVTSETMKDRRYLWVEDLKAAFGGVYVFENLHVWIADTPTPQDRANWVAELEALMERKPQIVAGGHADGPADTGYDSLVFTRDYLLAIEEEIARAEDSTTLIAAMQARYPGLGLVNGLEIGAKVAMGEMRWG